MTGVDIMIWVGGFISGVGLMLLWINWGTRGGGKDG